jgi:hypothetical protein
VTQTVAGLLAVDVGLYCAGNQLSPAGNYGMTRRA